MILKNKEGGPSNEKDEDFDFFSHDQSDFFGFPRCSRPEPGPAGQTSSA